MAIGVGSEYTQEVMSPEAFLDSYRDALEKSGLSPEQFTLYASIIRNPQILTPKLINDEALPPAATFNNLHLKLVLPTDPDYSELTLSPERQKLYYDLCNLVGPAIVATELGPPLVSNYSFLKDSEGNPLPGALNPESHFYRKVKLAATAPSYQAFLKDPEKYSLPALEFLTELYRQARKVYDHFTLWA